MAKYNFEDVDVLLIEPDRGARESLRNILYNSGFRELRIGSGVASVREELEVSTPDLIICDTDLPDGSVYDVIADIRHSRLGDNPFVPVIATTWNPTAELVTNVVNSGTDDLITKPISAGQLLARLRAIITKRKSFIVTSDYIGPDRQKHNDRGDREDLIEVPNALQERIGGGTGDDTQVEIQSALAAVNEHRLERYAGDIVSGVDFLLPRLEQGSIDNLVTAGLERLSRMLEDAGARMEGTKYAHVSNLCESLLTVSNALLAAGDEPESKDMQLLRPLSQAIQAGFDSSAQTATAALAISETLIGADGSSGDAQAPDVDQDFEVMRKNVRFVAGKNGHSAMNDGDNQRENFLLRLLTGKISHLFGDRADANTAIVPRQFIYGFDTYIGMLLGEVLYEELNSSARDLLANFDTDDDLVIWREIGNDSEYKYFTFNILIRVLMKFERFEKGRQNFLSIINSAIAELNRDSPLAGSKDVVTNHHFQIVFATLFADIFEMLDDDDDGAKIDFRFGEGTRDKLSEIYKNYSETLKPSNKLSADDLRPEASAS